MHNNIEGEKTMYKEIQNLKKVITTEFAEAVKEGKSHRLTPDPSPDRGEGRKITSPHPQPFSLMRRREQVAAFTLAETLITVVILGILAAILVPNLIKNQVENANRTKVKKAMAAYEKAINIMIIENDIKSTEALRDLGQDNCQYTREYFKTVKDSSNNCIFKTADRVWWDITDITNPILILKDSQLEKTETELKTLAKNVNDNMVFALVGRFDDLGTLRINDNAYEQTYGTADQRKYVGKLWYFITQSISVLTGVQKCDAQKESTCIIITNGVTTTYTKISITSDIERKQSKAPAGDYWLTDNLGLSSLEEAKSEDTCKSSSWGYTNCKNDGDYYQAAILKCQKSGGHLTSLAELMIARIGGKAVASAGKYWASEEVSSNRAYYTSGSSSVSAGGDGIQNKNYPSNNVICVGD